MLASYRPGGSCWPVVREAIRPETRENALRAPRAGIRYSRHHAHHGRRSGFLIALQARPGSRPGHPDRTVRSPGPHRKRHPVKCVRTRHTRSEGASEAQKFCGNQCGNRKSTNREFPLCFSHLRALFPRNRESISVSESRNLSDLHLDSNNPSPS